MQPIHLAIGLVEGLITSAVLCFIYDARPELLWMYQKKERGKLSYKVSVGALACAALAVGGLLSLAASSNPDGLEWSMEKVSGTTELSASGTIHQAAQKIQELTAFLPDYSFKGSEGAVGTSVSGIVGAVIVAALCIVICICIRNIRKKKVK